ncbi:hypothetical protein ACRJ4B_14890 [Streptomyces sp. GTA36]
MTAAWWRSGPGGIWSGILTRLALQVDLQRDGAHEGASLFIPGVQLEPRFDVVVDGGELYVLVAPGAVFDVGGDPHRGGNRGPGGHQAVVERGGGVLLPARHVLVERVPAGRVEHGVLVQDVPPAAELQLHAVDVPLGLGGDVEVPGCPDGARHQIRVEAGERRQVGGQERRAGVPQLLRAEGAVAHHGADEMGDGAIARSDAESDGRPLGRDQLLEVPVPPVRTQSLVQVAQGPGDSAAERVFRVPARGRGEDQSGVGVPLVGQDLPRPGRQQRGDLAGEFLGGGQLTQDDGGETRGGRRIPGTSQDEAQPAARCAQGDTEPPAVQPGLRRPELDEQARLAGLLEGGAGGEQAGYGLAGRVGVAGIGQGRGVAGDRVQDA